MPQLQEQNQDVLLIDVREVARRISLTKALAMVCFRATPTADLREKHRKKIASTPMPQQGIELCDRKTAHTRGEK